MAKEQIGFMVSGSVKRKLRVVAARRSLTMAEFVRRLVEREVKDEPDPIVQSETKTSVVA